MQISALSIMSEQSKKGYLSKYLKKKKKKKRSNSSISKNKLIDEDESLQQQLLSSESIETLPSSHVLNNTASTRHTHDQKRRIVRLNHNDGSGWTSNTPDIGNGGDDSSDNSQSKGRRYDSDADTDSDSDVEVARKPR